MLIIDAYTIYIFVYQQINCFSVCNNRILLIEKKSNVINNQELFRLLFEDMAVCNLHVFAGANEIKYHPIGWSLGTLHLSSESSRYRA